MSRKGGTLMDYVISRTDDEIYHHGVKGQKWGVRRYQNPDGSLTSLGRLKYKHNKEFKTKVDRERALEKARAAKDAKKTAAERKAELLKSTDPEKLYANRDLLTTAELNERILRIDTEARLAAKLPEKKAPIDVANANIKKISNAISSASNMFQQIDNTYNSVMKSSIGKTLAKQLGIETEPAKKEFDYNAFMKNINKKSNQEVADAAKRIVNENMLRKNVNELNNSKKSKSNDAYAKAKKQVDDYINSGYKDDKVVSPNTYQYTKSGSDIIDSKIVTGGKNQTSYPRIEQKIAPYTEQKMDSVSDNVLSIGERQVTTFLLEDKSRK